MQSYSFNINTYKVEVNQFNNEYHVSLDGVHAGVIFPEKMEEPPFTIWKTSDLIPEDLVQKIGAAIEQEQR